MCGIGGFVDKQGKYGDSTIREMLELIKHRGPDDSGTYHDGAVRLGHRRLSILDLSPDGRQPMTDADASVAITFNGEIYNYREIKQVLKEKGYHFRTKTDTEVLLAAYQQWGPECVSHFNGMWAFAIWDKHKQQLFCSRDRFGIKPFYYCDTEEVFAFASEIKQLLMFIGPGPEANRDHLIAFLTNGSLDYSEDTMFQGIKQLPGGCSLLLDPGTGESRITRWYHLDNTPPPQAKGNQEKDNQKFADCFKQSVRLRLNADVPVGSCLSGGMDSSAIVCEMNKILKEEGKSSIQHTVSSCFDDKAYDEQEYIDSVSSCTGVKSHKVYPDMKLFLQELDKIIWHMDEPFGSTSIYAQWNVFREAKKQGLTVMLDGQGADEHLGGYTVFYSVLFTGLIRKGRFISFWRELKNFHKLRAVSENTPLWMHCAKALLNAFVPFRLRMYLMNIYYTKLRTTPFPKEFYQNKDIYRIRKEHNERDVRQFICASMYSGLPELLHYEDRDSMAHSIESRVPFLDYKLVEESFSMPLEHKIKDGKTKYVLREGLKDLLPEKVYNRTTKLGFATPEDKWYRECSGEIRAELEAACDTLKTILNKNDVMRWYDQNIQKVRYGDFSIFRIICAAHWVNIFHVKL